MNVQSMQQPSFSGLFKVTRLDKDLSVLAKQVQKQIPEAKVSFKYVTEDIFTKKEEPGRYLKEFRAFVPPKQDINTMRLLKQTRKAPEKRIDVLIDYTNIGDSSMC